MNLTAALQAPPPDAPPGLLTILREWGRIGCIGFGGPPTHIALLRDLCVQQRGWIDGEEFEDAIAACNLLPGPASTQLAIFCAWRLRGRPGAVVGALGFIVPGLALILVLASIFLGSPPQWVRAAGAGAGAAVAAVALQAGASLLPASRLRSGRTHPVSWTAYLLVGALASATLGSLLVVVLVGCGVLELLRRRLRSTGVLAGLAPLPLVAAVATGGTLSLAWLALKVGALSFGGGFVIVPLMQADAVNHYHWLTQAGFLDAVALGQITPGPVVQTVAVIGYAAAGVGGGLLAALVAFSPSLGFVLIGGPRFGRLRTNIDAQAFLSGAGPASIGAILGASIPLTRALTEPWQYAITAGAGVALLVLRRGIVTTLLAAGVIGVIVVLAGGSLPH